MVDQDTSYQKKIQALRTEMARQGLDGFIVPRTDEYQGEFVAPYAERLLWLTGFSGSAGTAVVLADKGAVFTDARYTIQLKQQVDGRIYEDINIAKMSPAAWLADHAGNGQVIGFDPWLHTPKQLADIENTLADKGAVLKPVNQNLVDQIWTGQPARPETEAETFPVEIAGTAHSEKMESLSAVLRQKDLYAAVIAMPDSLAWLLNMRGRDTAYTPVLLSYGVLYGDTPFLKWFIKPGRVSSKVRALLGNQVEIIDPAALEEEVAKLAQEAGDKGRGIGLDFARTPLWFKAALEKDGADIIDFKDPCIEPRAIKTPAEQDAIRQAHIYDGAALCAFLAWFDQEAAPGTVTEMDVVRRLDECRRAQHESYKGPSFPTIAGAGPNGAVIHYRPTAETNRVIEKNSLLLIDSGGQYAQGTTDLTRTLAVGTPAKEMQEHYTRVLKGHIAVARALFPAGTNGTQIDALARQPLWEGGLDYAHGTGHGVGCYLAVHEEAANLSPRGQQALKPGMLISNEPGYYREGAYGIRIENLVLVTEAPAQDEQGQAVLGFETVSLVPMDRRLIVKDLLTKPEKQWVNEYHAAVYEKVTPLLDPPTARWLKEQTRPL